ncbi:MAG TPA: M1 family metallopeptidase [Acidimicrobiales bacterium]|nr:M1 family metallopeptidase [Acidimicrobiales bacterium]
MSTQGAHRLPRSVEPEHYELTFTVHLEEASFAGEERVRVQVHEAVSEVVLNAADLQILEAELLADDGGVLTGDVQLLPADERALISFDGTAEPGPHTLHLTWSGKLSDKLHGVYRSTFTDADGVEHTIAATQFEPADARRAFPCWDEPDRKATFAMTLVVDKDLAVVSNSELVEVTDLGEGRVQHEFAPTMRMSTYLVAFAVGPLEASPPLDVDGTALRAVAVPGKQHLCGFALDVGAHALRFFADYFGLPYPAAKLDLIALPDFAMGAMENLGAVTFRETLLLIDPDRATRGELERVADVVAHEVAHMWFGDLVTMRWWNGIWLNEAFATFMELLCVDAYRPEWQRWVTFGTSRDDAMVIDALASTRPVEFPVVRPDDAEGMFDILTYQKGASVLRMLERYVGAEEFRSGISRYIAAHSHANTDTADLWDAVEEATGQPARTIMDSWILQGGFPIVSASIAPGGTAVQLTQRRFRYLAPDAASGAPPDSSGEVWRIPVHLRASVGGRVEHRRLLLDAAGATVDLAGESSAAGDQVDWVVVNECVWGFYRVGYDEILRSRLTANLDQLDAIERLGLVSDTWARVLAAETTVQEFLELAALLAGDDDPSVWQAVIDGLVALDRVVSEADRPDLQAFVRRLAGPALDRLGWSSDGPDDERRVRLRAALIRALGVLGADPVVRRTAVEVHAAAVADPASADADVAGAALLVVAAGGGVAEYEEFLNHRQAAATPQEELRYLYGLASFEDPELVERTLALALDEVRPQNAPFVITLLLANRAGGAAVWDAVKRRWDDLAAKLPENLHERALGGVVSLSTPELASDIRSFLEAHPLPSRARTVSQLLERLDVAVALRRREGPTLGQALRTAADLVPDAPR